MVSTWVVPGGPLENGAGWRIWYSRPGEADFRPETVEVYLAGNRVETREDWWLFERLEGIGRRMGVLTIRLAQPRPGTSFDVSVPELGTFRRLRWPSLPDRLDERGVAFLLGSCFWRNSDQEGAYAAAVREMIRVWQPAFKVLAGDQVYQDWPAAPFTTRTAMGQYAERYAESWQDPGLQDVLQSCPNLFMCDDHEFWNNYPEFQPHLSRTWSPASRAEYGQIATVLYEHYQRRANPGTTRWHSFTIEPVSFFISDTRSERSRMEESSPHFFPEDQWRDLEAWARGLRGPGVLVLGQPLYQKIGDFRDYALANFVEDHGRLCALFENSLRGDNDDERAHDILMLSGDIHAGRFAVGRISGLDGANEVYEFIASAAARVWQPEFETPTVEEPPATFAAVHEGVSRKWDIDVIREQGFPTIDNNVGLIRMFPGSNDRVRFELSSWQVRPYQSQAFWKRSPGPVPSTGSPRQLFRKELELR